MSVPHCYLTPVARRTADFLAGVQLFGSDSPLPSWHPAGFYGVAAAAGPIVAYCVINRVYRGSPRPALQPLFYAAAGLSFGNLLVARWGGSSAALSPGAEPLNTSSMTRRALHRKIRHLTKLFGGTAPESTRVPPRRVQTLLVDDPEHGAPQAGLPRRLG